MALARVPGLGGRHRGGGVAGAARAPPSFPASFGSIQDARAFCQTFFRWYNYDHYHSGIAWLHPVDVHYGRAERILTERAEVLTAAHAANPERFVNKHPQPPRLPAEAWINKPSTGQGPPAGSLNETLKLVPRRA